MGDHQHSTRVVLAHDFQDATYVRQSLDYAQFGRVTATLGANGLADATGVVTVFGHHGSVTDAATGLQHKGERWYSPDLGRFVSEDPIQDGSNWFMFSGNDPVNQRDPSGLFQQGHPLGGGYSGNVTRQPTIKPGNIPANALSTIGTPLGHAVSRGHGTRSEPAPVARSSSKPLTINDFTTLNDLSNITRQKSPDYSLKMSDAGASLRRYEEDQMRQALGRAHAAELADIAERQAIRGRSVKQQVLDMADTGSGVTPFVSDVRDGYEVLYGKDAFSGQRLSGVERGATVVAAALPFLSGSTVRKALRIELEARPNPSKISDPTRRANVSRAQDYEDNLVGAASDVATQRRVVPALNYQNPNPRGRSYVKFDGVDPNNASVLIDRKVNVTTKSKQLTQLRRQADVLRQNPGYSLRIEVPNAAAAKAANKALDKAGVGSAPISIRIVP